MVAFERIRSGLAGLDEALDNIRLGDNVVWRVTSIEDYRFVVEPFVRQSVGDGRSLVYIRFAQHEPLIEAQPGVKIYELDPSPGFESFTDKVHEIIAREGRGAFYVFDSLSQLQEAWSTDLMMGNFFRVTCPYLFQLDTVAYFPLLRGMHSFEAVARIRETTQLFLEAYRGEREFYLHPLKVWNRYSNDMFLPHRYDRASGRFLPLTDGVSVSRFYTALDRASFAKDQNLDSWDRYFSLLRLQAGQGALPGDTGRRLCGLMMTKDERITALIERHFTPEDYFLIRDRMIGTGMIGGKACGMLLARKLVSARLPESAIRMEPHDSFYIGSDVFYTYVVHNDCWKLRLRQRAEQERFDAAEEFAARLQAGQFPQDIREQFRRMLDYFGQSPVIVRSSSFLEDGFGNAFAGKYESVFCAGGGSEEARLARFEDAVRTVYASTMNPSALEYRRVRGLLDRDEQMAILVQRVSGSRFSDLYMPAAAGVGYSQSTYLWQPDIDPSAGMLRLVMGLGTRAVDRTEGDYPRVVSLDKPLSGTVSGLRDRHRFSQHTVDVIDLSADAFCAKPLEQILDRLPDWYKKAVLSRDTEAEQSLSNLNRSGEVRFADCQGLIENREFVSLMRNILKVLQAQYGGPVDTEFTVNLSPSGDFMVNLLQCRPLTVSVSQATEIAQVPDERVLFDLSGSAMGRSRHDAVDIVVSVDPERYYRSPMARKAEIARAVGKINRAFQGRSLNLMLIVPGRIGTSSPELGVPVVYAEISRFCAVCEVSYGAAGYMPELSYGSHMFQDFVESDIFYGAIFEDERTRLYRPGLLAPRPNLLARLCPACEALIDTVGVYDLRGAGLTLSYDMAAGRALCAMIE